MPVAAFCFYIYLEAKMFDIQTQLFEGRTSASVPLITRRIPEIEARWTHDSEFMRMMDVAPARPMSAALVKKQYEKLEKQMDEDKNLYYFAIRAREDDRLIGKAMRSVDRVGERQWLSSPGHWPADDRGKGYGSEALQMLLRFGFAELNLFRLSAIVPEYNTAAIACSRNSALSEEVGGVSRLSATPAAGTCLSSAC
jgi:RimJ/RimL family protein N-acetyltransferase